MLLYIVLYSIIIRSLPTEKQKMFSEGFSTATPVIMLLSIKQSLAPKSRGESRLVCVQVVLLII